LTGHAGEAYSVPPDPLAGLRGKEGRQGRGRERQSGKKERGMKGKENRRKGMEGK